MQASAPLPDTLYGGRLTIDRDAIAANWAQLRSRLKDGTDCAATIKADAYGTGLAGTGQRLFEAGCSTFFVALPTEGVALRQSLPEARIFVLDGLFPDTCDIYVQNRLIPVLGSLAEIQEWSGYCHGHSAPLPAAIQIDTGMNRLGLRPDAFAAVMADEALTGPFEVALLLTHLAYGSDPAHPMNARQLSVFRAATEPFPAIARSMANSAGVFLGPEYHFDLARPGISLYGGKALDTAPNTMAPAVMVEARVMLLRDVPEGETVGYGAAQTTQRETKVAVVAAGYADGMLRRASSSDGRPGGFGCIGGHRVPLIGRISMDMIALDVTDVPAGLVERGCLVEMLGPNVAAADLAAYAETIDYEYLTGLGHRYQRRYQPLPVAT